MKQLLRTFFLILLISLSVLKTKAEEQVYLFSPACQQAYHEITSLKLNNGLKYIQQAKAQNANNLIPQLLEGYIDFFVLFFNEDPAEYKIRKIHFDQRIAQLSEGPKNSPYYNYCLSMAYLQKATIAVKFGEQWTAVWNFRKAFSLIKENKKAYPDFLPNDIIYAPMQVIIGVVPDNYKWATNLLGLKGSVKTGMSLMKNFVNSEQPEAKFFFNEAAFYYCYLLFYIDNKPDEVFQFVHDKQLDVVNNHLFAFLVANMALNDKKTEYAKNIITQRNQSKEYFSTPIWDFEMAYVKLHHLELADAAAYFEKFLRNFKGKNYVKDSYQKLSWCYYLQNKKEEALRARTLLLKKGSVQTDADKQAQKDAESGKWPNPLLLQARLLNDGGYNNEALKILQGKSVQSFQNEDEQLEFVYRVARIYDDLGKDDEAIKAYMAAIKLGKEKTAYYASRAALQIGYIYEMQGKKSLAIAFYQQCIDMKNHDFKDSIDQKAKAGIARCKGE